MISILRKYFKKSVPKNRLFFSACSGRSGSGYLAKLLGTAIEVNSFHEPEPWMEGKYLRMVNDSSYSKTFRKRQIKCKAIEKILSKMSPEQVYSEIAHMFLITFFDVVSDYFDNVEVIILRRELSLVLKSLIELGLFSKINSAWPDWTPSPNSKTSALTCIDSDSVLDQYDLCIAYLFDTEARAIRFQKKFPQIKTHDITLETLNDYDKAVSFFKDLKITPTDQTRELAGKPVNTREEGKKIYNNPSDLDYCTKRIELYIQKALAKGISIPHTLHFNQLSKFI